MQRGRLKFGAGLPAGPWWSGSATTGTSKCIARLSCFASASSDLLFISSRNFAIISCISRYMDVKTSKLFGRHERGQALIAPLLVSADTGNLPYSQLKPHATFHSASMTLAATLSTVAAALSVQTTNWIIHCTSHLAVSLSQTLQHVSSVGARPLNVSTLMVPVYVQIPPPGRPRLHRPSVSYSEPCKTLAISFRCSTPRRKVSLQGYLARAVGR